MILQNKNLTLVAYYLSKYDLDAINYLGYSSRTEAFKKLSNAFDRDDNYLKYRRDEFDVLTNSHRNGWKNRLPSKSVLETFESCDKMTFDELSDIVFSLINHEDSSLSNQEMLPFSESEIENIINFKDETSVRNSAFRNVYTRIYNQSILQNLKKLYDYKCQICGENPASVFNTEIVEAHHIQPFHISTNNNASNIMILCPNHHRIMHKSNPEYDPQNKIYLFSNGEKLSLSLNYHL